MKGQQSENKQPGPKRPPQPKPQKRVLQKFSIRRILAQAQKLKEQPKTETLPEDVPIPTKDNVQSQKAPDFVPPQSTHLLDINVNPALQLADPTNLGVLAEVDSDSSDGSSSSSSKSPNSRANEIRRRFAAFAYETQMSGNIEEEEHSSSTEEIVKVIEKRRVDKQMEEDVEFDQETTGKLPRSGLAMICILALLFLGHVGATVYLFMTPEPYEHPHTCLTGNCRRMSKWLKSAMNKSVDPCDDFYLYTCGKLLSENPVPEPPKNATISFLDGIPYKYDGNEKLGRFLKPVDEFPLNQILPYYKSCMFQKRRDEIGYEPLITLLTKLKLRDPHLSGATKPSITRIMVRIYKMIGKMFLIDVNEVVNNYITVGISKPSEEVRHPNPAVYANTVRKVYKIFAEDFNIRSEDEMDNVVFRIMSFEAELNMIQTKGATIPIFGFPNNMGKYTKLPKEEFQSASYRTASFSWDEFMDALFVRDTFNYRGNLAERPVILFNYLYSCLTHEDRFYILVLEQFLRRTPLQTLIYYFQWNVIKTFAFDLTTELQNIMKAIYVTAGKTDVERCFRSVFYNLNSLAADRYSRDIEDINQTRFQAETISRVITEGIKTVSESLPKEMRRHFQDLLSTIKITNGLFSQKSQHTATFYTGLNMSDETYFDNVVQARNIRARNEIFRLRKIYPFQDWPMSSYSLNEINVVAIQDSYANYRYFYTPFGSLDEPFVGNALPAMDFGGMGFWIVSYYTILQIVVDILKDLAYDRNQQDSLEGVKQQKDLEMILLPRLECIYDAYGELEMPQLPGVKLNQYGTNIKLKDLGDAIALEALTKIFELSKNNKDLFPEHQLLKGFEHYSPEQLFFHSLARHCCLSAAKTILRYQLQNGPTPFHLRVNGAFRLSTLFSKAWSCPRKSFMNAKKKCTFFKPHKNIITERLEKKPPKQGHQIKTSGGDNYEL